MERVKEDGVRGPTHLLRHTALHMQTRIAEQTPLLRVRHGKLTNCLPVCVCVRERHRQHKDSIPLYITSCLEHTPVGGAKAVKLRDRAPTPPPPGMDTHTHTLKHHSHFPSSHCRPPCLALAQSFQTALSLSFHPVLTDSCVCVCAQLTALSFQTIFMSTTHMSFLVPAISWSDEGSAASELQFLYVQ